MALDAAQKRGLAVDSGARERELRATLGSLGPERDRYREGIGFADIAEAAYLLVGLAASGAPPDGTTDAIVRYLLSNQSPDGSWPPTMQRVPSDGCALALTAMSLRALSLYARNDESAAGAAASVGRARAFLSRAAAVTNEELTFQVLGLRWAGAAPAELAPLLGRLLARQQGDGGFAQRDGLASDAYATSQAIVALRDPSAPPAAKAALQRALQFLLADQRLDGSWFVATRALRFQPFLESGFPQHRSQYSSALATSWAVMALSPEIP